MNQINRGGKWLITVVHRIIPNLITLNLIVSRQMMGNIALLCNREREKGKKKKLKKIQNENRECQKEKSESKLIMERI